VDEQPLPAPEESVDMASTPLDAEAALALLPVADEATELIALIDRLEGVLERSGLAELEVGSGATTIVLRSASSMAPLTRPSPPPPAPEPEAPRPADAAIEPEPSRHHAVLAPLTGIYYTAPSPDAAPYVRVGAQIVVGQVIGLIEAMKLYNEIKSDVAGRVVRLAAENGKLVKAKQALMEVEPS
jgi:acetyl-CoA carboxylase biotin carboxyl carrier protein